MKPSTSYPENGRFVAALAFQSIMKLLFILSFGIRTQNLVLYLKQTFDFFLFFPGPNRIGCYPENKGKHAGRGQEIRERY